MKSSTRDRIKGKFHDLKGNIKEKVGHVTDSPALEAEGREEKLEGTIQEKVGQIKQVFDR